jgi:hypothetical protein
MALPGQANAAADSVRLEGMPPGGSARLPEGLPLGLSVAQPLTSPVHLVVRIAGENGAVYYRRALLEPRPTEWVAQPYPNPLRSGEQLTLDLTLPGPATVDVRVYNVAGRLVEEPFRHLAVQATQSVRYTPGAHLGSGIYFLRIDGGRKSDTRRFLLLR